MGGADLHTHTTFSDGVLTPTELVRAAKEIGLQAVAITDHDSVEGVPEGLEAGRRLGIEVVPGVEINTDVPGSEVHMLGYFMNLDSEALHRSLREQREGRLRRAERMVAQLQAIDIPVSLERVLEIVGDEGAVGRPHVAKALVEMGVVADVREAFDLYLGRGKAGYVPRRKFTPEQAIAVIREAGGVPVLAHPAHCGCDEQIPSWIRAGMEGIEVDHTDHADEQTQHYRYLARSHGLIATVGSDFHGLPGSGAVLGGRTCGITVVQRLRAAARNVSHHRDTEDTEGG